MAHLPLHGIQTKAQRLHTLAHEVSVSGAHTTWTYRLAESIQPLLQTRGSLFRYFPETPEASVLDSRPARAGQG